MAEICGDSVLTGQDGSIEFKPPGTSFCLDDFSDFGTDGTTSHITVPCTHDFRVGDIVCFYEGVGASLDTALQASTDPDRVVHGLFKTAQSSASAVPLQDPATQTAATPTSL